MHSVLPDSILEACTATAQMFHSTCCATPEKQLTDRAPIGMISYTELDTSCRCSDLPT